MEVNKDYLLNFLKFEQQLSIPLYQRFYSWDDKQCRQLWTDILEINLDSPVNSHHFMGPIVYIQEKFSAPSELSKYFLIDGQQRLTTLNLLMIALCQYLKDFPNPNIGYNWRDLLEIYLINPHKKGNEIYKLNLTESDNYSLHRLIDNLNPADDLVKPESSKDSQNIINNFNFFYRRINENNIKEVYDKIQGLTIIYITLIQGEDNPQLIFESLNSTGLELSKSDLIRNFVLLGLSPEEQEKLYNDYWHEMEVELYDPNNMLFDNFIRDYLTIKLKGKKPTFDGIYVKFKDFAKNYPKIGILVNDIYTYFTYYRDIVLDKSEDKEIKFHFNRLNQLNFNVTRPFTLSVYKDYKNNVISKEELLEIIKLVEIYVFRRNICEIPTVSLSKTFATLYYEINKKDYVESLKAKLVLKDSYKRLPNDEEFKERFLTKDIYWFRNTEYILSNLENYKHPKEHINFKDYSIEHIMPQNPKLSKEWKKCLGPNYKEIQEKYIHTIGNLTITAYNPELSDKPFNQKRDMEKGFKDSPLYLNHYLASLDTWNEETIKTRANDLIDLALEIWPYPQVSKENIEKYK